MLLRLGQTQLSNSVREEEIVLGHDFRKSARSQKIQKIQKFKFTPPQTGNLDELERLEGFEPLDEDSYDRILLEKLVAGPISVRHLTVESSVFDHVNLASSTLEEGALRDIAFDTCDFANLQAVEARVRRCHFKGVRLTGANFSGAKFDGVFFEACRIDIASFFNAEMISVGFKSCDLTDSDFREADLAGCLFEDCKLDGVQFFGSRLKGARFVDCNLEGARIGASDLKGVIMAPNQVIDQSLFMARLLEIEIEKED